MKTKQSAMFEAVSTCCNFHMWWKQCSKTLSTQLCLLSFLFRQFNFNFSYLAPKKLDDQIWIAICHDGMRTHTTSWRVLLIYFNSQIELQLHRKRSMNDDFYNVGSCDSKCALARFLGVLCVHYWKIIDNSLFMYRSLL